MSITTLAGVISGNQPPQFYNKFFAASATAGKCYSAWAGTGFPGAGSFDTTLNGVTLSSSSSIPAGAIPHYDPGAGSAYLSRFQANANVGLIAMLCDRLWHNGGITANSSSLQSITSPTWPARDADGATAGKSVYLGLEV